MQGEQWGTWENAGMGEERGGEGHTIQSIVRCQSHALWDLNRRFQEMAEQRERKKPLSDRRAIRRFFAGPCLVQVDPLLIFRSFRKQGNPFLRNTEPFCNPYFLADQVFQ